MIWRIRERAAFTRLTQDGRRTRAGALWCSYLLDPSASPPRVAFAIGRSLGPAVVRNRARRRLRMLLAGASLPPGWYLFGASRAIAERPFAALASDVTTIAATIRRSDQHSPHGQTRAPGSCA